MKPPKETCHTNMSRSSINLFQVDISSLMVLLVHANCQTCHSQNVYGSGQEATGPGHHCFGGLGGWQLDFVSTFSLNWRRMKLFRWEAAVMTTGHAICVCSHESEAVCAGSVLTAKRRRAAKLVAVLTSGTNYFSIGYEPSFPSRHSLTLARIWCFFRRASPSTPSHQCCNEPRVHGFPLLKLSWLS